MQGADAAERYSSRCSSFSPLRAGGRLENEQSNELQHHFHPYVQGTDEKLLSEFCICNFSPLRAGGRLISCLYGQKRIGFSPLCAGTRLVLPPQSLANIPFHPYVQETDGAGVGDQGALDVFSPLRAGDRLLLAVLPIQAYFFTPGGGQAKTDSAMGIRSFFSSLYAGGRHDKALMPEPSPSFHPCVQGAD